MSLYQVEHGRREVARVRGAAVFVRHARERLAQRHRSAAAMTLWGKSFPGGPNSHEVRMIHRPRPSPKASCAASSPASLLAPYGLRGSVTSSSR